MIDGKDTKEQTDKQTKAERETIVQGRIIKKHLAYKTFSHSQWEKRIKDIAVICFKIRKTNNKRNLGNKISEMSRYKRLSE